MAHPDFSEFPLVPKGNQFEDFAEGQVFEHHWGRTLTESDATLFSTLALRFTPLYFNREYARAHDHADLVVDPLLALCSTVVSTRTSEKRPQFGIVTWRTEGLNQDEELVLSYQRTNLVQRRRSDA